MRPDDAVIDEAAQWMALLQSGEASAGERAAFDAWRQPTRDISGSSNKWTAV
jgi:ferric-dicitrate binding protein FerR (iron transport regulator)